MYAMWLIIEKLGWDVVYNVFQHPDGQSSTMPPLMTTPSWAVVYNVSQNPVSPLSTIWLIMTKAGWAVVYNVI